MAIDDEDRVGWVSRVNDTDPPDYHVISSYRFDNDEWPLPNPGDTPGIHRLTPSSVNAEGTVVGTALRKKVAVPLRQDIRDSHVTYQSGFIFEKGKLRFDPPPPFLGDFNVSYHRINNAGLIFGHREIRTREGDRDIFTTRAFLGKHVFMDVPAFDTSDMTEGGHLLCMRLREGKLESFAWDGTRFRDLGSLAGKPEAVRAFAINQRLQIVGLSDAVDKDHCPIGFLWQDGRMQAFSDLIPEEFRPHLRSAIPYLITDRGSILFKGEMKSGPFPRYWPKQT
jgi:hypothetical protein